MKRFNWDLYKSFPDSLDDGFSEYSVSATSMHNVASQKRAIKKMLDGQEKVTAAKRITIVHEEGQSQVFKSRNGFTKSQLLLAAIKVVRKYGVSYHYISDCVIEGIRRDSKGHFHVEIGS